jgi:hypothetical protein
MCAQPMSRRLKYLSLILLALLSILASTAMVAALRPLSVEQQDFLYLAKIIDRQTHVGQTKSESIRVLTDWLAENVLSTSKYPGWGRNDAYPPWFNPRSVATVIQGGIGNCGYQANSIIEFAQYLGVRQARRYFVGEITGSDFEHAFAELRVDGRWELYDPNMVRYVIGEDGYPMSLDRLVSANSHVPHLGFRLIIEELRASPSVLALTPVTPARLPFGENSLPVYRVYGDYPIRMYWALKYRMLTALCLGAGLWLLGAYLVVFLSTTNAAEISRFLTQGINDGH